ncbi:MAG TPA: SRPBCC family protein [Patescibacteria group bacterium]|nr:SRPBCC family protein [Patescibacteria group bacterium]
MQNTFVATSSITIKAPVARVWDALTNPEMIAKYLFGTKTETDWKVGSPITYTGAWEGKTYQDKGMVLANVPEKLLKSTYWSSMSGKPDKPENYQIVTYTLVPNGSETTLTVTQEQITSEADRDHSEDNWNVVLTTMKKLLEA